MPFECLGYYPAMALCIYTLFISQQLAIIVLCISLQVALVGKS